MVIGISARATSPGGPGASRPPDVQPGEATRAAPTSVAPSMRACRAQEVAAPAAAMPPAISYVPEREDALAFRARRAVNTN